MGTNGLSHLDLPGSREPTPQEKTEKKRKGKPQKLIPFSKIRLPESNLMAAGLLLIKLVAKHTTTLNKVYLRALHQTFTLTIKYFTNKINLFRIIS